MARVHDADSIYDASVSPELLSYLADAFAHFLNGKDKLESSIGIRKRRHLGWLYAMTPHVVRDLYTVEKRDKPKGAIGRTARAMRLRRKQVERMLFKK